MGKCFLLCIFLFFILMFVYALIVVIYGHGERFGNSSSETLHKFVCTTLHLNAHLQLIIVNYFTINWCLRKKVTVSLVIIAWLSWYRVFEKSTYPYIFGHHICMNWKFITEYCYLVQLCVIHSLYSISVWCASLCCFQRSDSATGFTEITVMRKVTGTPGTHSTLK